MAEYLIEAVKSDATDATRIVIDIRISRDGEPIGHWVSRYSAGLSDNDIRLEIVRRIQEYIKVDAGIIEAGQVEDRAAAIADSIDGHLEIL